MKFIKKGKIIIKVDFDSEKMDRLKIEVEDTGSGIKQEDFLKFLGIAPEDYDTSKERLILMFEESIGTNSSLEFPSVL